MNIARDPEAFRDLRIRCGITQVEVADAIRVSRASVNKFERLHHQNGRHKIGGIGQDKARRAAEWLVERAKAMA